MIIILSTYPIRPKDDGTPMVDWRHHYSSSGQKSEGEATEIHNENYNSDIVI